MQTKRNKKSVLVKDSSRGALTIMNVTFNDETAVKQTRFGRTKGGTGAKKPYGTNAFHLSSKKRFERIHMLNEEMKEKATIPELNFENSLSPRARASGSIIGS